MSLISDFIMAPPGSGEEVGRSDRPSDHWTAFEAKGVETVKLATLFCLVSGRPYSNEVQRSFKLVGGNQDEGPWVFEFPQNVVGSLAAIDQAQLPALASAWASTEELRMDRWTAKDAEEFIASLSLHARAAVSSSMSVYLWLAL
jgi:hypothetical protein